MTDEELFESAKVSYSENILRRCLIHSSCANLMRILNLFLKQEEITSNMLQKEFMLSPPNASKILYEMELLGFLKVVGRQGRLKKYGLVEKNEKKILLQYKNIILKSYEAHQNGDCKFLDWTTLAEMCKEEGIEI